MSKEEHTYTLQSKQHQNEKKAAVAVTNGTVIRLNVGIHNHTLKHTNKQTEVKKKKKTIARNIENGDCSQQY